MSMNLRLSVQFAKETRDGRNRSTRTKLRSHASSTVFSPFSFFRPEPQDAYKADELSQLTFPSMRVHTMTFCQVGTSSGLGDSYVKKLTN